MPCRFSGKLGMFEMELAAERIISILNEKHYNPGINDMQSDEERVGYVELVSGGGYMFRGMYNGQFYPTVHFFKKLGEMPPEWLVNSLKG